MNRPDPRGTATLPTVRKSVGRRYKRIRVRINSLLLECRTKGYLIHEPLASLSEKDGTPQASLLECLEASGVPVIERRYAPGQHPYMRGDPDERLCFLLEGTLEVYKLYGAFSEATVRLLDHKGLFGEPSLRSEGRHRDSAQAVSACRVAKVPKGPLLRLLLGMRAVPRRCSGPSPGAARSARPRWGGCSTGRWTAD